MATLRRAPQGTITFTPALFGWQSLPDKERPVFHIKPLTADEFEDAKDASGLFDLQFDASNDQFKVDSISRREVKLKTQIVASQVKKIENLDTDQGQQIGDGKALVQVIAEMDQDGVDLLNALYRAIRRGSHVTPHEKKTSA